MQKITEDCECIFVYKRIVVLCQPPPKVAISEPTAQKSVRLFCFPRIGHIIAEQICTQYFIATYTFLHNKLFALGEFYPSKLCRMMLPQTHVFNIQSFNIFFKKMFSSNKSLTVYKVACNTYIFSKVLPLVRVWCCLGVVVFFLVVAELWTMLQASGRAPIRICCSSLFVILTVESLLSCL